MSVSSSPMFPALSVVSLLLAGSALYFAQQQPEPVPVQTPASFDSSGLEESISALRQAGPVTRERNRANHRNRRSGDGGTWCRTGADCSTSRQER